MVNFCEEVKKVKNNNHTWLYMMLGCFLMAAAVKLFFDPCGLVVGGFSGVAVILKKIFGVPLGTTMAALNIPLFLGAYSMLGRKAFLKGLFGAAMLTLFIWMIPEPAYIPREDYFLASLYGGVLTGIGLGFIFLAEGSTGGTDLAALLIHKRFPSIRETRALQTIDGSIVLVGIAVFGVKMVLYAIISIGIVTWLSERMLEGAVRGKMMIIISKRHEDITKELLYSLEVGITGLQGMGKYSRTEGEVLLCVVSKKKIQPVKNAVLDIDPDAFVILTDVREVVGEGFLKMHQ